MYLLSAILDFESHLLCSYFDTLSFLFSQGSRKTNFFLTVVLLKLPKLEQCQNDLHLLSASS